MLRAEGYVYVQYGWEVRRAWSKSDSPGEEGKVAEEL